MEVRVPLVFAPVYQPLVWGGRRLTKWGRSLPPGPIGEAWELADHDWGMSVVAQGPLAGRRLRELVTSAGAALVGGGFAGGEFPLMVKLIDVLCVSAVRSTPTPHWRASWAWGGHGKSATLYFPPAPSSKRNLGGQRSSSVPRTQVYRPGGYAPYLVVVPRKRRLPASPTHRNKRGLSSPVALRNCQCYRRN